MVETVQVSYCTVCDALPGECEHDGAARYLDDVVYEKAPHGWRPPAAEREDWERRRDAVFGSATEPLHTAGLRKPEPVQKLVVELESELDLDRDLERRFRELYDRDPTKATSLAARAVREARTGKLDRPEAWLAWRLKELARDV